MRTQKIIVTAVVLSLPFLMSTMYKTSGGHPASTGAPGDQTCAQPGCHSTATVNPGDGVNTFVYPELDSTYIPGQTYTISIQVQKPLIAKFGFELVALRDSDDTSVGQLIVTQSSRTHLITASVNSKLRTYITHSTNGTPAVTQGNTNWSFNWTAPSQNEGTITFYYVTNCTNNNGANTGDALYLSSFRIKPSTAVSVEETILNNDVRINYVSSDNSIDLSYTLKRSSRLSVSLFDMEGRKISSAEYDHSVPGNYSDRMSLDSRISPGIYIVSLTGNNKSLSKKFIIN